LGKPIVKAAIGNDLVPVVRVEIISPHRAYQSLARLIATPCHAVVLASGVVIVAGWRRGIIIAAAAKRTNRLAAFMS
jgi:hypothetical protein